MKAKSHFLMIAVAVLSLVFNGCKKNDGIDTDNSIIGRWTIVKTEYKNTVNGQIFTETAMANAGTYLEFSGNNSFIRESTEHTMSGTWALQNNRVYLYIGGSSEPMQEMEITKLTKSELLLSGRDANVSYLSEYVIHLKR